MARSTFIYLVTDPQDGGASLAAFTVKHEMVKWVTKYSEWSQLDVWRLVDGDPYDRAITLMQVWKDGKLLREPEKERVVDIIQPRTSEEVRWEDDGGA